MMKNYSSYNNNASYDSQTLHIIRSIVDELYQINNQEISSSNEHKEKRVRFTLQQETDEMGSVISNELESIETPVINTFEKDKSSIKYQPMLSESATIVCCLNEGRSKVDCSVSTHDLSSLQCECATQTVDMTVVPEYSPSLMSLSRDNDDQASIDFHRPRSNISLSTTWISSKPTTSHRTSSLSTTNHSFYSCENNHIVPLLCTAHQLILPSKAKHSDICQEQTLENYNTLFNNKINTSNASSQLNDYDSLLESNRKLLDKIIVETGVRICTCSKRKLSDNHFSTVKFAFPNQLEDLHLSKRSLQLMYNDDLFYIHDLVFVFLKNISQFYQILLKQYHLSKKQANLFAKVMNQWWEKHQAQFINANEKLLKTNIIK